MDLVQPAIEEGIRTDRRPGSRPTQPRDRDRRNRCEAELETRRPTATHTSEETRLETLMQEAPVAAAPAARRATPPTFWPGPRARNRRYAYAPAAVDDDTSRSDAELQANTLMDAKPSGWD